MELEVQITASPPSSPLSLLSNSPSPPSSPIALEMDPSKRYPSPSSTAQSGSSSPIKLEAAPQEIRVRTDGPPPAKRRRTQAPRKRTTEYLSLDDELDDEAQVRLDRLLTVLRRKKKVVVIAGAGISVSAGIPDFRSSTGLFTTLRDEHKLKGSGKHLFDASVYKHNDATTSFHAMVRELAHLTQKAKPTPFHHLLASLAHEGRLLRLYSQNVDCIDTSMPPLATSVPLNTKGPWPTTIQLHGGLDSMVCTKCGKLSQFVGSLFEGPLPPPCQACQELDNVRTQFGGKRSHGVGRLRPRIVLYNEHNPDDEAIGNVVKADLRRVPDAVIVVGTSMKIPGLRRLTKEMCQLTRSRRDGFTAWLNIDPEPQGVEFKDCWDLVVQAKCDDVAELANLPHWDEQDIGDSWKIPEGQETDASAKLEHADIRILLDARPPTPVKQEPPATPTGQQNDVDGKPKHGDIRIILDAKPSSSVKQEAKSRLFEQVQGGILTPSASPKLRAALPDQPVRGRKAQSKLSFVGHNGKTTKAAGDSTAMGGTKALGGRQRKSTNLTQAFKATKNVVAPSDLLPKADGTPRQDHPHRRASDPSSPPEHLTYNGSILPPLRDPGPYYATRTALQSSFSSSPTGHNRRSSTDTVSPASKPQRMEGLID